MPKSKSRPGHASKVASRNAQAQKLANTQAEAAASLDRVVTQYGEAFSAVKHAMTGIEREQRKMADIVDALASLVDPDLLANAVRAVQDKKSVQEASRARALIDQLVAKGEWKVADKALAGTLIALKEFDQDGKEVTPYLQVGFDGLPPALKNAFVGKGVDATYTFPDRAVTAVITNIWSQS